MAAVVSAAAALRTKSRQQPKCAPLAADVEIAAVAAVPLAVEPAAAAAVEPAAAPLAAAVAPVSVAAATQVASLMALAAGVVTKHCWSGVDWTDAPRHVRAVVLDQALRSQPLPRVLATPLAAGLRPDVLAGAARRRCGGGSDLSAAAIGAAACALLTHRQIPLPAIEQFCLQTRTTWTGADVAQLHAAAPWTRSLPALGGSGAARRCVGPPPVPRLVTRSALGSELGDSPVSSGASGRSTASAASSASLSRTTSNSSFSFAELFFSALPPALAAPAAAAAAADPTPSALVALAPPAKRARRARAGQRRPALRVDSWRDDAALAELDSAELLGDTGCN
eukprot:TRINITY_DN4425_c0_g1_i1.p2 TRINITY_DN4425_c0_g1~~TRINITY_DN4425_c0_g1_i1.p2  ORF type:complete len:354 (-),score=107.39 TRINITY_DN4425_c0_g1_i1:105-1118(-)